MERGRRAALGLAVVLACATVLVVLSRPPGIYSDPAWGLLAAEQWWSGHSSGPRQLAQADGRDLTQTAEGTVSWWPPGYQALPLAFHALGVGWGWSVRTTVLSSWLLAVLGWGVLFHRLLGGRAWLWLTVCFMGLRFTHAGADIYDGGESLMLAAAPWATLALLHAVEAERGGRALAAMAGCIWGLLFLLKYSSLLMAAGLAVGLCGLAVLRRIEWARAGAFCGALAATHLSLRGLGVPGGLTPGDMQLAQLAPERLLLAPMRTVLGATDIDSLLRFVLMHPARPVPGGAAWVAAAGAVLTVLVALVLMQLARRGVWRPGREWGGRAQLLLLLAALSSAFGFGLLAALGANVDDAARHLRIQGLLVLPLVLAVASAALRAGGALPRALGASLWVGLAVVPAAYGCATLLDKGVARPVGATVDRHGIRLDVLGGDADARAFEAELRAAVPADGVLYLTSPALGIALADRRMLVRHADFTEAEALASERFEGCPAGGVLAVLPRAFEDNGKRDIITQSFVDVERWRTRSSNAAPQWLLLWGSCADDP